MPIASSLLNKPRLVEKLRKFYDYIQKNDGKVGTKTRGIDLNFNNACNLRCKYCFTNSPKGDHVKEYLDIGAIKKLADDGLWPRVPSRSGRQRTRRAPPSRMQCRRPIQISQAGNGQPHQHRTGHSQA